MIIDETINKCVIESECPTGMYAYVTVGIHMFRCLVKYVIGSVETSHIAFLLVRLQQLTFSFLCDLLKYYLVRLNIIVWLYVKYQAGNQFCYGVKVL